MAYMVDLSVDQGTIYPRSTVVLVLDHVLEYVVQYMYGVLVRSTSSSTKKYYYLLLIRSPFNDTCHFEIEYPHTYRSV
jgi:hypothetical protein